MTTHCLLIYVFCTSCKLEIVLPVLQIKTKAISHCWFVQNTLINKELVIQLVLYFFSCRKFQKQLHKCFDPSAMCSRTILKLQFVQEQYKLTIIYCSFFLHNRNIFWHIIMYQTNAELAWKYAQIRQNWRRGKKTQILNFVSDDAERNLWRASEQ